MDMLRSVQESLYSSGISPILVALVATLLVTSIALLAALRRRNRLPPGPFAWPVVGTFLLWLGFCLTRSSEALQPSMQSRSVPTIVVSTVGVSKELFKTCDATFLDRPKGPTPDILTDNYKNFVVANGRYWRELRRFCASELFAPKRFATYKATREEEIHNMMKVLVEDANHGRPVNLKSWLLGITSD